MQAIPTIYKGVQYRSRLEARWAVFFDLVGWTYQYEPFDLDGWIPDFMLDRNPRLLVEVKPVTTFPKEVAEKVVRAAPDVEILILGCALPVGFPSQILSPLDGVPFGWLYGHFPDWRFREKDEPRWSYAIIQMFRHEVCERLGWNDREGIGFYHGQDHVLQFAPDCILPSDKYTELSRYATNRMNCSVGIKRPGLKEQIILALWNKAGNLVQWRGKQSITE